MKTKAQTHRGHRLLRTAGHWLMLGIGSASFSTYAAITDIANSPLATSSVTEVKPNIMFILDDSGSMNWTHMPDGVRSWRSRAGYKNHLCNPIYYNPEETYKLPVDAAGNSLPAPSFTNAWNNGFNRRNNDRTNLSTSFRAYTNTSSNGGGNDTSQAAYYYRWKGTGTPSDSDCNSTSSSNWEKVTVGTSERQNFANWYTYYRTRLLTMKSAAGRAFSPITDEFRVGFITINPGSTVSDSKYLAIDDFTSGSNNQKELWYDILYGTTASGGTPLREALSRVGRHYAGKTDGINSGMNEDPVQYSCQRNYAILTTDGFWNGADGQTLTGSSMRNSNYDGNADTAPPPFFDGTGSGAGSSGSLSDVAYYYYGTDLRPNMPNNVPPAGQGEEDDSATHQHMTTFTMGFGVSGDLDYRSDYKEATSGHYAEIKAGTRNWPIPKADTKTAIDDVWHAAVNGRGRYFSAGNPESAANSLQDALNTIAGALGQGTGVSASNPLLTSDGVNRAYESSYTSMEWTGDLVARPINPSTGELGSPVWSAKTRVNALTAEACDTRDIKLYRAGATNNMVDFKWNTRSCDVNGDPTGDASTTLNDAEKAFFDASRVALLSQHPTMTTSPVDQRTPAAGANLVNFIRGQRQHEDFQPGINGRYYRKRAAVLGDIVHSQPAYVGTARYNYADDGYEAYRTTTATRQSMIYVAGNDGMLHAFNADSGNESWAFIPSFVLPQLYKLASQGYNRLHEFLLDGSPTVGDVKINDTWMTLLVGGAGRGGKGYYGLDVTNPASPKALWEFKHSDTCYDAGNASTHHADCDLGRSIAEPRFTKLADGTWVVLITSGYNNASGKGHLYVLDAGTGKILKKLSTTAGDADTPSGLGKLTVYGPALGIDNTAVYVYAGDLLGNVWRFDINSGEVFLVTTLNRDGTPQPITTRIVLGETGRPATLTLFVGTGRYLGVSDIGNTETQTMYAIKDNAASPLTNPRGTLAQRVLSSSDGTRSIAGSCTAGERGWYVDLPDSGERLSIDPQFVGNVIVFASNVPSDQACLIGGGYSWLNYLDAETGCAISSADGLVGKKFDEGQMPGLSIVVTTGDETKTYRPGGGVEDIPTNTGDPEGRIISRRELIR